MNRDVRVWHQQIAPQLRTLVDDFQKLDGEHDRLKSAARDVAELLPHPTAVDEETAVRLREFNRAIAGLPSLGEGGAAAKAYRAYAKSTAGKTFDGRDMLPWDVLPSRIQMAWAAAALSVVGSFAELVMCKEAPASTTNEDDEQVRP